MFRLHPRSTLTYTLFPYPTLFRSADGFEHIARELRHQHAPERARRAADPDHRSHRLAREHIRDEREAVGRPRRSEEHTSEHQSLMSIAYAVLCWKKKKDAKTTTGEANHEHDAGVTTNKRSIG